MTGSPSLCQVVCVFPQSRQADAPPYRSIVFLLSMHSGIGVPLLGDTDLIIFGDLQALQVGAPIILNEKITRTQLPK